MWSNCVLFSALQGNVIRKRQVLSNMELPESRKMTFLENLKNSREFPPGISGTIDSREWPWAAQGMYKDTSPSIFGMYKIQKKD